MRELFNFTCSVWMKFSLILFFGIGFFMFLTQSNDSFFLLLFLVSLMFTTLAFLSFFTILYFFQKFYNLAKNKWILYLIGGINSFFFNLVMFIYFKFDTYENEIILGFIGTFILGQISIYFTKYQKSNQPVEEYS